LLSIQEWGLAPLPAPLFINRTISTQRSWNVDNFLLPIRTLLKPFAARGTLRLTPLEPSFIGKKRVFYAGKAIERCGSNDKNYEINGAKHSIVFQKHKDECLHSSLCF
jgi:hypothetical protein